MVIQSMFRLLGNPLGPIVLGHLKLVSVSAVELDRPSL